MMDDAWQSLLDKLEEQVLEALQGEIIEDHAEIARLAKDYESYQRMGHAPARALRLAEQLLFQQRQYANGDLVQALAMEVTARLAHIYRKWEAARKGDQSGQ